MKKSDIVLVPFPFTDLSGIKIRPALVLSEKASDVIPSFITTKLNWIDKNDILINADSENGLKKNSVIKLSKIVTIDKKLLKGILGNISENQLFQVNQNLIKVLELNNN